MAADLFVGQQKFSTVSQCPMDTSALVPSVSDSSALKCRRHFGPRIKRCFATVLRNVDPLYIRYSNGMEVLG